MSIISKNLRKKQVKKIKRLIVSGKGLSEVAGLYNVSYMTIYKIAAGLTWNNVKPTGKLIGDRDYKSKRVFSLAQCERIALKKMKKRFSNNRIATKLETSESTIQRAVENGMASLGMKLHKSSLNGGFTKEQKGYQLTDEEIQYLIDISVSGDVPKWIRKENESERKKVR